MFGYFARRADDDLYVVTFFKLVSPHNRHGDDHRVRIADPDYLPYHLDSPRRTFELCYNKIIAPWALTYLDYALTYYLAFGEENKKE